MTLVEVVPPAGRRAGSLLGALDAFAELPIDAYSVATNPVAIARMSALVLFHLIHERTGRQAILHCTTRDHNRLGLQALLWGALALGIDTVLCATGDLVGVQERGTVTTVRDLDVLALVRMARQTGLAVGVAFDPHPEADGLELGASRLLLKAQAGAQFAVTQPVYDEASAGAVRKATKRAGVPTLMGILPLRTLRHADFLHQKVAGIGIPRLVRERIAQARDAAAEGAANAREMLALARDGFQGACLMPPFGHYKILSDILRPSTD